MESKFGEMTAAEERDYVIGSSKFYSEGATVIGTLDELYNITADGKEHILKFKDNYKENND